ncbi:AI-2E family transporter [Mucilaginibacter terrenus]|uniref:AI-2E family transporter n=1 Tax=Mucilaginibacter terrenus TaxID=2482727 RepID=UPI0014042572|nr:AI-2E family transporter [Mucilaginibacter terrenus]
MTTVNNFNQTLRILLLFVLVFGILYLGAPVFIPLTFGAILAMLLLPVCHWLQRRGVNNGIASLLSVICLLLLISGVIFLLETQLSDLLQDLSKIEKRVASLIEGVKSYIQNSFGISKAEQQKMIKEQQGGGMERVTGLITTLVGSFAGILIDAILVLVYTFLFIYFRAHFKAFILRLLSRSNRETAKDVLQNASSVTQSYLGGLGLMIVMLWVMYGIGFSIVGVKNAIFFAILCGILELVPFAGNVTGTSITVLMSLAQGGDSGTIAGILITYGCVQLLQTYILEPLVVGDRLNINPVFTILIIVVGEEVWGIAGMVVAVPLLGIFKIVCDNCEPLNDIGFLIGPPREKKSDEGNFLTRLFKKSS